MRWVVIRGWSNGSSSGGGEMILFCQIAIGTLELSPNLYRLHVDEMG